MNKRPHRITFRLSTTELEAFKMLVYATRSWDESKLARLLIQIGCEVVRADLSEEQVARVVTSYASNQLLQRYRIASLAPTTQRAGKVPSSAGCGKFFRPGKKSDKGSAGGAKKKQ
jgi:hypothetical protein